jgi:hypothetical protein
MSSSSRAEKRACTEKGDPLSNASILQHVMSYVSPSIYLYIAGVSRLWKQSYEQVTHEAARKAEPLEWKRAVTEVPRTTRYSVAFGSVALLTWAFTSGLELDGANQLLQYAAGAYGSLLTLAVAHGLGLRFNDHTLHGAVDSNREPIVDLLHIQHGCPMAWYVGFTAAGSGNVRMLKFLREKGFKFGHFAMCCDAAEGGHLETLKYLRQQGCSWFYPTIAGSAARSGNLEMVSIQYLMNSTLINPHLCTMHSSVKHLSCSHANVHMRSLTAHTVLSFVTLRLFSVNTQTAAVGAAARRHCPRCQHYG